MIADKQVPAATVKAQQWRYYWKQSFLWWSVPRGYNEDNWSKNRQLEGKCHSKKTWPGSRGVAIVRSRYQATASEDTAGWKDLVCDL
jgi:hypothetical protein